MKIKNNKSILRAVISFLVITVFWEIFASGFIPTFSQVVVTFINLISHPGFNENITVSLYRLFSGWALGAFFGTLIGLAMGVNYKVKEHIMPVVSAVFPIPKIALLPLLMVLFGLGETSKILTIAIGAFFPSIITAYSAVLRTPAEYIEQGQSLGLTGLQITRLIIVPTNLPYLIQGCRTSTNLSLTLLVAAEMLGSQKGLGNWILISGGNMLFDQMLAGIICLSLLGLFISFLIDFTHKLLCPWDTAITDRDKINVTNHFTSR